MFDGNSAGEWAYSTHFGSPSSPPAAAQWLDRAEVLTAILDMAGPELMVQVRTPLIKAMTVGGVAVAHMAPVSPTQAYGSLEVARVAHHNDCFLASDKDWGTYTDVAIDYPYLAQDTTCVRCYAVVSVVGLARLGV